MSTSTQSLTAPTAEAFLERFFSSALATAELMSAYLGDRLGWYADLAAHPASTADQLARRTGTNARYAREWLEMQSAYGILEADTASAPVTFTLPAGPAEVLLNHTSLAYLGALPRMFAASFRHLPELLDAYRHGGGVPSSTAAAVRRPLTACQVAAARRLRPRFPAAAIRRAGRQQAAARPRHKGRRRPRLATAPHTRPVVAGSPPDQHPSLSRQPGPRR